MQNIASCHSVADFFLLQIDQNAGDTISNLKLQKLCYYAQAWALALGDPPLFGERIEAWAHGPVIPELYHRFKKYKWNAIDPSEVSSDPYQDLHAQDIGFLGDIWAKYGGLSAKQLERLTHSESPWKDAYGDTRPGGACDVEIGHQAMKDYYSRGLINAE